MGAKLRITRNICLCSIVSLFLTNSCSTQQRLNPLEEEFVLNFKSAVLYGALNEFTKGDLQKLSLAYNDLGLAPEAAVVLHANAEDAKGIGEKFVRTVKPIDYGDYEGRSPFYSHSVRYAFGYEVDSIARLRYKELSTDDIR